MCVKGVLDREKISITWRSWQTTAGCRLSRRWPPPVPGRPERTVARRILHSRHYGAVQNSKFSPIRHGRPPSRQSRTRDVIEILVEQSASAGGSVGSLKLGQGGYYFVIVEDAGKKGAGRFARSRPVVTYGTVQVNMTVHDVNDRAGQWLAWWKTGRLDTKSTWRRRRIWTWTTTGGSRTAWVWIRTSCLTISPSLNWSTWPVHWWKSRSSPSISTATIRTNIGWRLKWRPRSVALRPSLVPSAGDSDPGRRQRRSSRLTKLPSSKPFQVFHLFFSGLFWTGTYLLFFFFAPTNSVRGSSRCR